MEDKERLRGDRLDKGDMRIEGTGETIDLRDSGIWGFMGLGDGDRVNKG